MVSILYTGALIANQQQSQGMNSLGGYVSLTQVPNGRLNSLFSDTCYYQQNKTECKLIAFKNLGSTINNVKVWMDSDDPLVSYQTALVSPTADVCGEMCFEKLSQSSDLPLYASFSSAVSEATAIILPSIQLNQIIGIWIKRTYDRDSLLSKKSRSYTTIAASTTTLENELKNLNIVIDFN